MPDRLRVLAASAAVLGLSLGACSSSSPSSSGSSSGSPSTPPRADAVVLLKYVSFVPARVTVHAGQTVEWKWDDAPIDHNVVFPGFGSGTMEKGTYFHTFDRPGTYSYRCTVHQTMTGVVVVLP
jgi:plastocyanin